MFIGWSFRFELTVFQFMLIKLHFEDKFFFFLPFIEFTYFFAIRLWVKSQFILKHICLITLSFSYWLLVHFSLQMRNFICKLMKIVFWRWDCCSMLDISSEIYFCSKSLWKSYLTVFLVVTLDWLYYLQILIYHQNIFQECLRMNRWLTETECYNKNGHQRGFVSNFHKVCTSACM